MSQKIALISVYNKDGVLDLAKGLGKSGVRILSTGGTKRIIEEAGFKVEDVSAITGKSSILQGRVKTLHQSVHGGILARDTEKDDEDLRNEAIAKIDYVICNLYPFSETIQKVNCTVEEAVEEIDIGGVTLLRAAAKNHERVTVLCDPQDYHDFLTELSSGNGSIKQSSRQRYCVKAFTHVAEYDNAIASFFRKSYMDREQYMSLRYGVNPHQSPASMSAISGGPLPFKVLCGAPGMVNMLDALNAFPLVKELEKACSLPAAASFKHCSPAGAAVGVPMKSEELEVNMVADIDGIESSGLAQAYARARGADRMSSFGDFIALSSEVDLPTAKIISREVSDGVIAPAYSSEAFEVLSKKKGGKYLILEINKDYEPPTTERREVYGIQLEQRRNNAEINPSKTFNTIITPKDSTPLPDSALRDLTVATLALKYTQSNSVCYALNGQVIGLGAGQQSRIHCTRLAGDKADNWWMRFHPRASNLKFKKGIKRPDKSNAIDMLCSGQAPRTPNAEKAEYDAKFEEVPQPFSTEERQEWLQKLENVVCSSDAFFPFTDNIHRAARSGVKYIAAPTGSQMDQAVFKTCEELEIVFVEQAVRLFHH